MIHEQEQEQETGKGQSKDERNGEGCLDAKTMPDSDSDDGPGGTVGDRRRRWWGRVLSEERCDLSTSSGWKQCHWLRYGSIFIYLYILYIIYDKINRKIEIYPVRLRYNIII